MPYEALAGCPPACSQRLLSRTQCSTLTFGLHIVRGACSERSCTLTLHPAQGYVSSADYSGKRAVLVLFINGRPVECAPLRRALEATYASVLPKAAKPFVFLVGLSNPASNTPPVSVVSPASVVSCVGAAGTGGVCWPSAHKACGCSGSMVN